MSRRRFPVTAAMLLFALALALNAELERTVRTNQRGHSLYLPSGPYLRWASLGYRAPLADWLYVWSIQYYSFEREDRWRWLAQTYDVITDLDPRFLAAYSVGALILALEAGRPDQALALLEKGIRLNPTRYLLPWEAAFYAKDMGQHERMSHYLDVARSRPDAPRYVARWHAYTLSQIGRREAAIALWREALEGARDDYERRVAQRRLHAIELEILLERVQEKVEAFRSREGRLPRGFAELERAGLLAGVPLDPVGRPLRYDPVTGAVSAESSFLRDHRMLR